MKVRNVKNITISSYTTLFGVLSSYDFILFQTNTKKKKGKNKDAHARLKKSMLFIIFANLYQSAVIAL
jgi:hypothetical protein